jgi:hypothetical protein
MFWKRILSGEDVYVVLDIYLDFYFYFLVGNILNCQLKLNLIT